jgi:hypothetical protein
MKPRRFLRFDVGEDLVAHGIGRRHGGFHVAHEPVVGGHGGQRDQKPDGGGDQRLGNTGHHCLRSHGRAGGQIVKRAHDAKHGAEQTDEGRVAAQGSQKGQAALVVQSIGFHDRGDVLLDGFGSVGDVVEARARHRGFHRARLAQCLACRFGPGFSQRRQHIGHLLPLAARAREEPQALEHHGRGGNAEANEQPQHPARPSSQHEVKGLRINEEWFMVFLPRSEP